MEAVFGLGAIFDFIATPFAVPFGYLMRFLYGLIGNYGLSIIVFTLIVKLLMLPISIKSKRSIMDQQRIQPKINELRKKYGKDQQRLQMEMQKVYEAEGVSMSGGCLPMLMTLPIMLGLYYVISRPLTYFMQLTSAEITTITERLGLSGTSLITGQINIASAVYEKFDLVRDISDKIVQLNFDFLGLDLGQTPEFGSFSVLWVIPILAGLTALLMSFVQRRTMPAAPGAPGGMNVMTFLLTPLMSLYFSFILPAGLGVYWISNNLFTAGQELVLGVYLTKKAARAAQDAPKRPPRAEALPTTQDDSAPDA